MLVREQLPHQCQVLWLRSCRDTAVADSHGDHMKRSRGCFATSFMKKLGDFRIWSVGLAALSALLWPKAFSWMSPTLVQGLLFVLLFLLGVTAQPADFQACLRRRRPIAINLVACFGIVPALAWILAKAMGLSAGLLVGIVLLASVNGGASANLFTLLAGGDVALSVVTTTFTTVVAVVATPCIVNLLLGAAIPVHAHFVLMPIFVGIFSNMLAPRFFARLKPAIPALVGTMAVPISGAVVVRGVSPSFSVGLTLHAAVIVLHVGSGCIGYLLSKVCGASEQECRTLAFTVAVKHVAFASVLASLHFEDPAVQVPPAVSCIWCPILCSAMANFWKANPAVLKGGKRGSSQSEDLECDECDFWVEHYRGA